MGVPMLLDAPVPLLRITAHQMLAMAERGAFNGLPRLELRDGMLCQMSPQHRPHALAKTALYDALRDALRALGSPLGVMQEVSVAVSLTEVPMPDVIVWDVQAGDGPVPVELVRLAVEVSDTTLADDLGRKRDVYAAGGIGEYWVVDLGGRVVHQHWQPIGTVYSRAARVPFGQPLASAVLPGVQVDTSTLR